MANIILKNRELNYLLKFRLLTLSLFVLCGFIDSVGRDFPLNAPGTFKLDGDLYCGRTEEGINTDGAAMSHPRNEFFDDFNYVDFDDVELAALGWTIVDGISGPPAEANYSKENISFEPDPELKRNKLMLLQTQTSNNIESMKLARIESEPVFLEGTYAARLYFDNSPEIYRDGNIETFYLISGLDFPNDPDYCEFDFEYLPHDIWGDGDYSKKLHLSSWETYQPDPWLANKVTTLVEGDFSGWHTFLLQATNGETVNYYIDGVLQCEHKHSDKNDNVYPENLMQIAFANWISPGINGEWLGSAESTRTCILKVDWVYHAKNTSLTPEQVELLIDDFRAGSVDRKNSMGLKAFKAN